MSDASSNDWPAPSASGTEPSEKNRRPWWRRKRFFLPFLSLLALVFVIELNTTDEDRARWQAERIAAQQPEPTQEVEQGSTEPVQSPTPSEEASVAEEPLENVQTPEQGQLVEGGAQSGDSNGEATWSQQPTDGFWALNPETDPSKVVAFGEASPPFGRCSMNDPSTGECDHFSIRITEAPNLEESRGWFARDVVLISKFSVERLSMWGDEGEFSALSQVEGRLWLEPAFSAYSAGWNEATGEGSVECPQEDVPVNGSMTCTVRIDLEYDWVENSAWELLREFWIGTWPSQQVFDPDSTLYDPSSAS